MKLTAFIEHELESVNKVYQQYTERLQGIVEIPLINEGYISSFAQYTIKLKNEKERDSLHAKLTENGIPSVVYYVKPLHKQKAFSSYECNVDELEISTELSGIVLSLPMHPYLTEEEVNEITECIINSIK